MGDTAPLSSPTGSIACYAHTSTMDAFLMSRVLPASQCAVAKAELFM